MTTDTAHAYFKDVTQKIPGWLLDYAADVTIALLEEQDRLAVNGAFLEIGVYGGKYLSIFYDNARHTRSLVVAVDPYEHFSVEQVTNYIGASSSDDFVKFITDLSVNINAAELSAALQGRCRFASIDGSHDPSDVAWDLGLAFSTLHPRGIIAVDDFLNTGCLGVVEAVGRLLSAEPNIAPLMFTSNKLFMCPLRSVGLYKEALLKYARSRLDIEQNRVFIEKYDANPNWAQTMFYNHSLFTM